VGHQGRQTLRRGLSRYFLAQIREQGLFDDLGTTHSEPKVDEDKHLVDVTLNFRASKGSDGASPSRPRRRGR
jgi:hypothetical protein